MTDDIKWVFGNIGSDPTKPSRRPKSMASPEEQTRFARAHPGEYVISFSPPKNPTREGK